MGTEVINSDRILQQLTSLGAFSDRTSEIESARLARGQRVSREFIPMIITTDQQVTLGDRGKYILFWSGPQNTTWTFQQRGVTQQTRTGYIAHYWLDNKRTTFFDDPSVSFTFQTGNIMPVREAVRADGTASLIFLPPGLLDYYDFFSLLDEPKILSSGRPNFVNIVYHSLLYPTILLRGFFEPESPITVTEDAQKPASVTWAATFRVSQSNPPLHDGSKLRDAWASQFAMTSLTLDELELEL
jgi:hypothetical protein